MLALKDRAALFPMALSGPAVSPVVDVSDRGVARAVAQPNGVLLLVEPELADQVGLGALGKLLGRAGNKPKVFVVARQFNPFQFSALTGLKVEHVKGRGKQFLQGLPVPAGDDEAPDVDLPKKAKQKASDNAPKFVFVGRDDELAELGGHLGSGGPIVVSGPHGIGKRSLVEHAIAASGLERLPDLTLGRGIGFDTLVARLAEVCKEGGNTVLFDTAARKEATPIEIVAAAVESLGAASLDGKVMLVEGLHTSLSRQGDFFRKSRLEMLLTALLTNTYPLRLVFTSAEQPRMYREGAGKHLRRMVVGGIKGRFLHEIFEAYKAPEFPRDRFGAMNDKIHGHPMAARMYAIEVRDRQDGLALTEDAKFMKMESVDALDALRKRLAKRVEKLSKNDRAALAAVAHVPRPLDGQEISDLGLSRKVRLQLLGQGLLDMVGTETDRKYRVHPLVRGQLTWRETSDFDLYGQLAESTWNALKNASGITKLVLEQDLNQYVVACRQMRRRVKTDLPDADALVESCIGMIRSKKPNFQLARQRLSEVVNAQPGNADAYLLKLELIATEARAEREAKREARKPGGKGRRDAEASETSEPDASDEGFSVVADAAMAQAPVPEVFHRVAGHWLSRRARHKAIEVLEQAIVALPDEARLHCRLGSLLLRHGRRNEAIAALQKAMDLEPMLPDAYGLLGMARRDEGTAALAEAESLLREAVRLAPDDPVQTARLADLLIHKAAAENDPGLRSDGFTEAKELLETSLRGDEKAPEAQLLLAQLHRRSGGDLERADWLLSQAKKNSERGSERHHRISLERALVLLARGDLDQAEAMVRDQAARNPSSHRAFATLAAVLEARQQFIPAHAEYLRAKERAPQGSLWAATYDGELTRMQALIEAHAAGLFQPSEPVATPDPAAGAGLRAAATGNTAHRVIRRKSGKKDDEGHDEAHDDDEVHAAAPEADTADTADTADVTAPDAPSEGETVETAETSEEAPEA
ncbi:MAG: tetratricopeptide repeat protein [Myxococcota bacterium]